jgi:hypothetical protein
LKVLSKALKPTIALFASLLAGFTIAAVSSYHIVPVGKSGYRFVFAALFLAVTLLLLVPMLGKGDEVIIQGNTYIASVMGITINGATPVFVEPDEYYELDTNKIEAAITPRTKAILPVHLYGHPCDMEKLMRIAKGHDLRYAIDPTKIHSELGWLPETKFADGIKLTVKWYLENKEWWEKIISGEYREYYARMYGK